MKIHFTITGVAIVAVLLSGCRISTMKRYKVAEYGGSDNTLVSLNLSSARIDPPSEKVTNKSLWDLQGEGQMAMINALNQRNASNSDFDMAIENKYLEKESGPLMLDYTTKDLKMIFAVDKERDFSYLGDANKKFSLADRIESINFTVTIPSSIALTFQKWNKYTTEYGAVDVGDLSFSKTLAATAGYGVSSSSSNQDRKGSEFEFTDLTNLLTKTPSVSATGAIGLTEAQKIKYRYIQLSGSLSDKILQLKEDGMREIDLAGNIIADVSLKFGEINDIAYQFPILHSPLGSPILLKDVKLKQINLKLPNLKDVPDEITGKLKLNYVYRHVTSGERTFFEWDDRVKYYNGTQETNVVLFKKEDYLPKLFFIGKIGQSGPVKPSTMQLMIKENGNFNVLTLTSFKEAEEFLHWLTNYSDPGYSNSATIKFGLYELFLKDTGPFTPVTKNYINANSANLVVHDMFK